MSFLNHPSKCSILNECKPLAPMHAGGLFGSYNDVQLAYQNNRNATVGYQANHSSGGTGGVSGGTAGPGAGSPVATSPGGPAAGSVAGGSGGAAGGTPRGGEDNGRIVPSSPGELQVRDNVTDEVIETNSSNPGTSANDMVHGITRNVGDTVTLLSHLGKKDCECSCERTCSDLS